MIEVGTVFVPSNVEELEWWNDVDINTLPRTTPTDDDDSTRRV